MSACHDWREQLLEAEPEELRGEGRGPLAEHLAGCEACRAVAERLLAANAALDGLLRTPAEVDAAAIVARARLGVADGSAPESGTPEPEQAGGGVPIRSRSGWRAVVGLGLAAGLTSLLFLRDGAPPTPGEATPGPEPSYALVDPTNDANVAVFETDDPDITVVWLF